MNFDVLKEKPIRIMCCQVDPSLCRPGVGNVFIKNIVEKWVLLFSFLIYLRKDLNLFSKYKIQVTLLKNGTKSLSKFT